MVQPILCRNMNEDSNSDPRNNASVYDAEYQNLSSYFSVVEDD